MWILGLKVGDEECRYSVMCFQREGRKVRKVVCDNCSNLKLLGFICRFESDNQRSAKNSSHN